MKDQTLTTIDKLKDALRAAWSRSSSTLWSEDNPARGQCGVTALVVNDLLGGEIVKTRFEQLWHFYNVIDGKVIDFTESQFDAPIAYDNRISNRDEAFADTNARQYDYLKSAVQHCLNNQST